MQMYSLIACLASGVTRSCESRMTIDLALEDFEVAMQKFGHLYLEPCKALWNCLEDACENIRSLGAQFADALGKELQTGKARLTVDLEEMPEVKPRGLQALVNRLNSEEGTRDMIQVDSTGRLLTIGNPSMVSYLRWVR